MHNPQRDASSAKRHQTVIYAVRPRTVPFPEELLTTQMTFPRALPNQVALMWTTYRRSISWWTALVSAVAMGNARSTTLYFGYGSNLWRDQMIRRCPQSTFAGIGRLDSYEWIINDRGYANVVPSSSADYTWGLIYTLTSSDEEALDRNEGVPHIYGKEMKDVHLWKADEEGGMDTQDGGELQKMLVYIDYERTKPSDPKEEYIYRMNKGIEDALRAGVPQCYIEEVIRKYIPACNPQDAATQELARRQAQNFEDE